MTETLKVFGIGMSKTGTTTLASCLEILGFVPHVGFEPQLKSWIKAGRDVEYVLSYAEPYRSFEDSPWYLIYKELDQRFPGSKFILTVRKDSMTHAKSSWSHGVRRGLRTGEPTQEYLLEKIKSYENHNSRVLEYFRERRQDFLVICWEKGDGWEELCEFLDVPIPNRPIPHRNQGRYKPRLPSFIADSTPYNAIVRAVHQFTLSPLARRVRRIVQGDSRIPSARSQEGGRL